MMKHLLILFLTIPIISFSQDKLTISPYWSLDFSLAGGEFADTVEITDGHATTGYGSTVGVNTQFFKGIGFKAEYSFVTFSTFGYVDEGEQYKNDFQKKYFLETRPPSGSSWLGSGQVGVIHSFKFGPTFTYEFNRFEVYASASFGYAPLSLINAFDLDTIGKVNYYHQQTGLDGFYALSYRSPGNIWSVGFDARFQVNLGKNKRFGFYIEPDFSFGKMNHTFTEQVIDPIYPEFDKLETVDVDLNYRWWNLNFGITMDVVKRKSDSK